MPLTSDWYIVENDNYIIHRNSSFESTQSIIMMLDSTSTGVLPMSIFLSKKKSLAKSF